MTVTPTNDGPVAVNDTATTAEDTAVTIAVLANDTDSDGDTLSVTLGRPGARHARSINAGRDHHLHAGARTTTARDSFIYTVSDGDGGTRRRWSS